MEGPYHALQDSFTFEQRRTERKCECTCFLLFVVMLLLYVGVFFAGVYWDAFSLILPYNSVGQQCGVPGPTKDYMYLYFVAPADNIRYSVCVQSCSDLSRCLPNQFVPSCGESFTYAKYSDENVTVPAYKAEPLWDAVCYPSAEVRRTYNVQGEVEKWLLKIDPPETVGDVILAVLSNTFSWIVPLGLCVAYFILLRHLADFANWLLVILHFLGLIWVGHAAFYAESPSAQAATINRAAGALLYVFAVIFLAAAVLMRRQVATTGVILKLGCSFLFSQFAIVIVGAVIYVMVMAAIVVGEVMGLMIYFSGDVINGEGGTLLLQMFFPLLKLDGKTTLLLLFEVQFTLWLVFFFLYFALLVIAHAVHRWYYDSQHIIPLLQFLPSTLHALPYVDQISFGALVQSLALPLSLGLTGLLYFGGEAMEAVSGKVVLQVVLAAFLTITAVVVALSRFAVINIVNSENSFPQAIGASFLLFSSNPLTFIAYALLTHLLTLSTWGGIVYSTVLLLDVALGTVTDPTVTSFFTVLTVTCSVLIVVEVFRAVCDALFMSALQDIDGRIEDASRPQLVKDLLSSLRSTPA